MAQDDKEKAESRFGQVSSTITLIGAVGALLGATGFIIVQANLQLYTQLSPYNISSYVYISAGAMFLAFLALCVSLLVRFYPWLRNKTPKWCPKLLSEKMRVWLLNTLTMFLVISTFFFQYEILFILSLVLIIWTIATQIIIAFDSSEDKDTFWQTLLSPLGVLLVILMILGISVCYGRSLYSRIDLGGGTPRAIQFVGKEDGKSFQNLGISMETETKTDPICQIAPLTDGVLIYDRRANKVFIVASREIVGKIDAGNQLDCDSFQISGRLYPKK